MKFKHFVLAVLVITVLLGSVVSAASGDRALKYGMRGDDVQYVQQLLLNHGYYNGAVDGVYGQVTYDAVQCFQASNGLEADGVVGAATMNYLLRTADSSANRYRRSMTMTATGYSAYDPGNSMYTAQGDIVHRGIVAVDPAVIPMGTRLYIPGYGYAVAGDTGGAIYGSHIDLAFDSHNEALNFGVRQVTVYILN